MFFSVVHQAPALQPAPRHENSDEDRIRRRGTSGGSHGPGNDGGYAMIVLAIAIICTIIFVIFIFNYSEVLSIAETVLNFIGGALAFIFSPIAFYATTFAIAAGDQNVPIYVFMPVAFFPIEIGLLFFVRAILSGPKIRRVPLEDELAYYFIAEFLVAISVILVSLYVSIMFHLYQKYILLIIGMTIVLVVTLGVRLLRLRLFFPESIRDISETIAYLRRRV